MKRKKTGETTVEQALMELQGELISQEAEFTVEDLCRSCKLPSDQVVALVQEGVLEVHGEDLTQWRFRISSFRRVRTAMRLQHDLGVNLAGAALALGQEWLRIAAR